MATLRSAHEAIDDVIVFTLRFPLEFAKQIRHVFWIIKENPPPKEEKKEPVGITRVVYHRNDLRHNEDLTRGFPIEFIMEFSMGKTRIDGTTTYNTVSRRQGVADGFNLFK